MPSTPHNLFLFEWVLSPIKELLVISKVRVAVPLGLSCKADCCCGFWHHGCVGMLVAFLLWKFTWTFCFHEAYLVSQGGGLKVSSSLELLGLSLKIRVSLSIRIHFPLLGSNTCNTIAYNVWESLGQPWTTTQNRFSHAWSWMFLLDCLWFLERALSAWTRNYLFKSCMYISATTSVYYRV